MQKLALLPPVTISVPGMRQRLSASHVVATAFTIQAASENSGSVYVGDETVDSSRGVELPAGYSMAVDAFTDQRIGTDIDLYDIWVDGSIAADRLIVSYMARKG